MLTIPNGCDTCHSPKLSPNIANGLRIAFGGTPRKDLRLTAIDTYSRTARATVHAIAVGLCSIVPSTINDGLKPVETSSDLAISRRGRSGDVAVTGAGREERC